MIILYAFPFLVASQHAKHKWEGSSELVERELEEFLLGPSSLAPVSPCPFCFFDHLHALCANSSI